MRYENVVNWPGFAKPVNQEQWAVDEALVAAAKRLGMKPAEVTEVWTGSDGFTRVRTIDRSIVVLVPDDQPDANGNAGPLVDPTSPSKASGGIPVFEPFQGARPKGPDADAERRALDERREFVAGHLEATRTELEAFRAEHLRGSDGRPSVTDALRAQERALEGVVRAWGDQIDEIDEKLNPKRPDDTYLANLRAGYLWAIAETDDELARVYAAHPQTRRWSRTPAMVANERSVAVAVFSKWAIPLPTLAEVPAVVAQGATAQPRRYNLPESTPAEA